MRVLQCIDGLQAGGKERRLLELLKGLRSSADIEVELAILSERVHYQEVFDLGIPIHFVTRAFRRDPRILWRLVSLCKAVRPDVIHAWGSFASICVIPAVALLDTGFVTSMITHAPLRSRLSMSRKLRAAMVFPFADAILANSKAGLESYRASPKKSLCIYNGFDFLRLDGIEADESVRARLGIETRYLVGMVASFSDNKDHGCFVAAAERVLDQDLDVTFITVGDGPTLEATRSMVSEKWRHRIQFLGRISGVEPIVNAMDIGVLCTNDQVHGEGISNSVLEYMALGKSVVATAGGGTGEIVTHEMSGFLVAPGDSDALANCLCALLKDDDRRLAMGAAARQRIRDHFSIERMVSQHLKVYRRVTGASAAPIEEGAR